MTSVCAYLMIISFLPNRRTGSPTYDTVRPLVYPNTDVFVICFHLNDWYSLQNVYNKVRLVIFWFFIRSTNGEIVFFPILFIIDCYLAITRPPLSHQSINTILELMFFFIFYYIFSGIRKYVNIRNQVRQSF